MFVAGKFTRVYKNERPRKKYGIEDDPSLLPVEARGAKSVLRRLQAIRGICPQAIGLLSFRGNKTCLSELYDSLLQTGTEGKNS